MQPQQQQGMGPCKTGIMLGGMMGAGIGGSAGIILGGAGGFFSGYRGVALLKQSGKLVFFNCTPVHILKTLKLRCVAR